MLNQIAQAIVLGGYYALIACGLSFMLSVMRVINLAHGSLLVLGGYFLWYLGENYQVSPFVGLLALVPLLALAGWALQRFLLARSARGGELLPILTTFGLAIVLDNLLFEQFGADTRSLAPYIGDMAWDSFELPGGIFVGQIGVLTLVAAIVLLAGCSCSSAAPEPARRSGRRRKIRIRPALSASTRAGRARLPLPLPWARSALPVPHSACGPRSTPIRVARNCSSPSKRRSSAARARSGARSLVASCWRWRRRRGRRSTRRAS